MNPYLTQRANRRWWVYPLMALFFALSALLLWRTCKAGERGDTHMVVLLLCLATAALYHDASEILTGDLPTPIKYHNAEIMSAYHAVEDLAVQKLLGMLPPELRETYAAVLDEDKDGDIYPLVRRPTSSRPTSSASRSARPATTSSSPPRRRRARHSMPLPCRRYIIFWSISFPRSSAISTSSARSVNKEDNLCVQS